MYNIIYYIYIIYIGLNTITSILQAPLDPYEASDVPIRGCRPVTTSGTSASSSSSKRGPSHLFSGYPLRN